MDSQNEANKLDLSKDRKELLELLLKEKGIALAPKLAITPRGEDVPPPLSFAQERLWVLYQMEPDSPYYNIPMALLCSGKLNITALQESLSKIIERHQVLRAVFKNKDGRPVQQYLPPEPISLPLTDLRHLPRPERDAEMQRLSAEEARRPFNLEQGPLLRAQLLRMDEDEHILLLTVHHIVADGISYSIFMKELKALYEAFLAGKPSPLPDLAFQFADFAYWQRQWLQGDVLQRKLGYWQERLENLSTLDLPTDHPRPPVQTYGGARQSLHFSQATAEALKALSRKQGVSLFATLLTAFQVLLYRYSGEEDIVVGYPVANRNYPGIEDLIGLFVNTLVLRANLADNPTFAQLLGQVHKTVLEAYEHQDLPFEKLVEVLRPERDMSRTPLFQVAFNLQNSLVVNIELPDLNIRLLEQPAGIAKFDLTLDVNETGEDLLAAIEYNTDLFEAGTIQRMLGHLQTLLEAILSNPQQPVSDLPLLTDRERRQLLEEWNNTRTDYPREACVHHLFEAQALKTPGAVAVCFEERSLTYQDLNQRANQLAYYLQKLGIGPGMMVGVCLERSWQMVVGLLGVLKAGGVYVPLDPSYPQERLAYIFADTRTPVLLTQQSLLGRLPQQQVRVVCLDQDWGAIAQEPSTNPNSQTSAGNLAYVMYTSGSTGVPKGICVPHRAIVRLVRNTDYAQLGPQDRVVQASNASFDAATFEIWGALLNGGTLIGIGKDLLLSPQAFAAYLREQRASALFLTTALFNELAEAVPQIFASVQHVLFGGEAVTPRWVKAILDHGSPGRLLHVYGPTENTTFSSWYRVETVAEDATTISIGRPLANSQIYILNDRLQPVPVGMPGELYVGGDGLAWGYLNRPELTAERFVPNPFGQTPGERLYKTGDIARYLPSGNIEFVNRNDFQVKIRGFRVEPGEIEATLTQHPAIQSAVVVLRADRPNDKQLVAFIVPNGRPPAFSELTGFLRPKLPEYMIPAAFIVLDALPLTPNGKIDRGALSTTLGRAAVTTEAGFVAPRNPIEEQLAAIWAEVLQQDRIGVYDSFFELGGHSLLAMRIISRMQETFQTPLSLRLIYEAHTIADMAQKIVSLQEGQPEQGAVESPIDRLERAEEEQLLADLDQLSDAEIDSLLGQMFSDSEAQ